MMRRVLVDIARRRRAHRRGGADAVRVPLESVELPASERDTDLVAIDCALEKLAAEDARQARVVELRFFGGLSMEETARVLGVSVRTRTATGRSPAPGCTAHFRTRVLYE
jgi:DNA-directed RNA polymerase specialized sigma24 family protein